jgi:hypothetical protein
MQRARLLSFLCVSTVLASSSALAGPFDLNNPPRGCVLQRPITAQRPRRRSPFVRQLRKASMAADFSNSCSAAARKAERAMGRLPPPTSRIWAISGPEWSRCPISRAVL